MLHYLTYFCFKGCVVIVYSKGQYSMYTKGQLHVQLNAGVEKEFNNENVLGKTVFLSL